ncbi:hypothetical protein [Devosia sp. 63-57]|uniref:hypothetical protein n=1 Tax=Devosia sp. 63-57 TaxID=1895751 RepID=UPI00086A14DA|nr:hypothetical protein [Devosia sp. 63-57]ODT49283.1 MAG: hypothetical protein ABS74_08960 [Pelagibacterium sp. SCN 63-126]ODU82246.1 MAG: hypothetical protein ABT14_17055 [Pelagibacterium sp. SCN 63-17]OJX43414.1 MAG: hypothetical protein BGO80_18810 [Devosia sp. 63-57]
MRFITTAVTFVVLALTGSHASAAEVQAGDHFQIDDKGTMARILSCWTTPYPKCSFRYEHPDGTMGPEIEGWNEDLAKQRDAWARPAPQPGPITPVNDLAQSCEMTQYAGIVDGSVTASDDLMRQLIRDYFTGVATDGYDVSVTIHSLVHGDPFYNTRSMLEGQGATLVTNGAPENAVIYPMRVKLSVCEEESQSTAQIVDHDWELYCFVDEYSQWRCGVAESY